jgi:hypothetical protein
MGLGCISWCWRPFLIAHRTALDSAVIFVYGIHGNVTLKKSFCSRCVLHIYHYLFKSSNNVFGEAHELWSFSLRNFLHPPIRPFSSVQIFSPASSINMRFDILTAASIKITVFWDMTPSYLVDSPTKMYGITSQKMALFVVTTARTPDLALCQFD